MHMNDRERMPSTKAVHGAPSLDDRGTGALEHSIAFPLLGSFAQQSLQARMQSDVG